MNILPLAMSNSSADRIMQFKVRLKGLQLFQVEIYFYSVLFQFAYGIQTVKGSWNATFNRSLRTANDLSDLAPRGLGVQYPVKAQATDAALGFCRWNPCIVCLRRLWVFIEDFTVLLQAQANAEPDRGSSERRTAHAQLLSGANGKPLTANMGKRESRRPSLQEGMPLPQRWFP